MLDMLQDSVAQGGTCEGRTEPWLHRPSRRHDSVAQSRTYEERLSCEDIIKAKLYGCPTFRNGYIFSFIKGMNKKTAKNISINLINNWQYIKADIIGSSNSLELYESKFVSDDVYREELEDYVVVFPEFRSRLSSGYLVASRVSLTICSPPHHSKVWIRISSLNGECQNPVSVKELNQFFGEVNRVCRSLMLLFKKYYEQTLEKEGFPISLKLKHEVWIETAAADLGKNAELLSSQDFSMYELFESKIENELRGMFWRIFQREVTNFEELKALSENNQWIRLNVYYPLDLTGICSKRNRSNRTEFICLVHTSTNELPLSCDETKESSRLLLRQIADV